MSYSKIIAQWKTLTENQIIDLLDLDPSALKKKNSYDETILMLAAQYGRIKVVKYLISKGVDLNWVINRPYHHKHGNNALRCAYYSGHFDIVNCLLDAGATDNGIYYLCDKTDGRSIFEQKARPCSFMDKAMSNRHLWLVERLMLTHAKFREQKQINKFLWNAVSENYIQAVDFFISQGADVNAILYDTNDGKKLLTTLQVACEQRNTAMLTVLVNAGAKDSEINQNCVFHQCAAFGFLKVVKLMYETYPELLNKTRSLDGRTPIKVAFCEGQVEVFEYLKSVGARYEPSDFQKGRRFFDAQHESYSSEILSKIETNSLTELMRAVLAGHFTRVEELLMQSNEVVNHVVNNPASPYHGKSALQLAFNVNIITGKAEGKGMILCALLEAGALIDATSLEPVLIMAAEYGSADLVQRLLDQYPDVPRERIVLALLNKDIWESCKYPLIKAARKGYHDIVRYLLPVVSDINAVINDGESLEEGNTALSFARQAGHCRTVKILLEAGALDCANLSRNLIHQAAQDGQLEMMKVLLNFDSKLLNQKDKVGNTALSWAAMSGHAHVVRYVLAKGADIFARTYCPGDPAHGRTALDWAIVCEHPSVVKMLTPYFFKSSSHHEWKRDYNTRKDYSNHSKFAHSLLVEIKSMSVQSRISRVDAVKFKALTCQLVYLVQCGVKFRMEERGELQRAIYFFQKQQKMFIHNLDVVTPNAPVRKKINRFNQSHPFWQSASMQADRQGYKFTVALIKSMSEASTFNGEKSLHVQSTSNPICR